MRILSKRQEAQGGTVHKLGVQNDVSGKIVTLYCEYADAPTKEINHDLVVMTGFAVSAGIGAVLGLIIYSVMVLQSRLSRG